MLELLACAAFCILQADPALGAVEYELHIDGQIAAYFAKPVVDFREHPDLWREHEFQTVWYAVGEDGQRSERPSNAVWFNRACLEHTGEIIDHGEWIERVGCERPCCEGCVCELPERYEECIDD